MRTELEKFYKDFRNDLVEVSDKIKAQSGDNTDDVDDGHIIDTSRLNDIVNEALLKKKS